MISDPKEYFTQVQSYLIEMDWGEGGEVYEVYKQYNDYFYSIEGARTIELMRVNGYCPEETAAEVLKKLKNYG